MTLIEQVNRISDQLQNGWSSDKAGKHCAVNQDLFERGLDNTRHKRWITLLILQFARYGKGPKLQILTIEELFAGKQPKHCTL